MRLEVHGQYAADYLKPLVSCQKCFFVKCLFVTNSLLIRITLLYKAGQVSVFLQSSFLGFSFN
ncbi:hypothetical protein Anas_10068 [Armadillidium nasatum]|uniref:Uncharacterized protein n=1 Tax=Armadillidium nasatum TaxID=96803 RepID=A0A5N5TIB8_9CRUS|nr:hypothetical protein Anas_10068 [Armadillidium nasatum]